MEVDEAVEEAEQQEPEEVVEDPDENNGEPQEAEDDQPTQEEGDVAGAEGEEVVEVKEPEDLQQEDTLEIRDEGGEPEVDPEPRQVKWDESVQDSPEGAVGPTGVIPQPLLKRLIAGMWASREMLNSEADTQIVMKTTLRELIIYVVFLFVIVYMTFSQYDRNYFILRSRIESLFVDQDKITTVKDFWEFAEEKMLDGLYWEELYNKGRPKTSFRCPTGELAKYPCPVPATDRNLMYENRMLGVPRIRQLRTSNASCYIQPDFRNAIKRCHAPYTVSLEDTSELRYPSPKYRKYTSESAWKYQDATLTKSSAYTGELTTYGGGGNVQNLNFQKNVSAAILAELKQNLWIDQGTRFVAVDFTVYNGNVNLFAVVKLVYEFPATGGLIPSADIQIVRLLKYNDGTDYILMAVEVLFAMFTIYYLIEELLEIRTHGCVYFANAGNLLDIVVIGVSFTQIILNIFNFISVRQVLDSLILQPFEFADFSHHSNYMKALTYLSGFNVFVAYIKVFKYLSFNKTMNQLSGTLSACWKDLSGFTVMFLIIFFSFAELGFLLFGSQVEDFRDLTNGCFTLFRTILGDFNFVVIEQADPVFGPLFFLSYIFFVFFVLLNVFLAIINDTYGEVKADIKSRKPAFQMGDFFMVGVNNVKCKAGIRDRKLDVENAVKMAAEDDGFVTYQELRENLKHSSFSDLEIDLYFDMFKDDPAMSAMILDEEEMHEEEIEREREKHLEGIDGDMMDDDPLTARPMSGKHARQRRSARIRSALEGSEPLEPNRFYDLQERMSKMEGTVGPLTSKIDILLQKLDDMKKSKRGVKKEKMNKMMQSIQADDTIDEETKNQQIQELVSNIDFSESRPTTSGDL